MLATRTEQAVALYAVTGAAGFIGSHLVDALLAAGHEVRGLDDLSSGSRANLDPGCPLVVADVADRDAVRELVEGTDGCFHLAAIASVIRTNQDWIGGNRTNLAGSVAVLEAARDAGCVPVVYASSAAVYGDLGSRAAHEDMMPSPLSAYGADKLATELHAGAGWHVHRLPSFGLRFFNVYGDRQNPCSPYSGVISIFSRSMALGAPVVVHGDGRQVRDFVHVSDVVRQLLAAMRHVNLRPGALLANVCTGHGTSLLELLDILGAIHRRTPAFSFAPPRPGDLRESVGDPSRGAALLGRAAVRLEDGLAALAEQRSIAA
jgi:UDP-glucose 4-epimerase